MNPKRITLIVLALALLLALAWLATPKRPTEPDPSTSGVAQPIRATLVTQKAPVEVTQGNVTTSALQTPMGLHDGDVVTTGSMGAADLSFMGNNVLHLNEGTSVVIGPHGAAVTTLGAVLLSGTAKLTAGSSEPGIEIGTPVGIVHLPPNKLSEVDIHFDQGIKVVTGAIDLTSAETGLGQVLVTGQEMTLDGLKVAAGGGKVDGLVLDVPPPPPPPLPADVAPEVGQTAVLSPNAVAWQRITQKQPLHLGETVRVAQGGSARVALDTAGAGDDGGMAVALGSRSRFVYLASKDGNDLREAEGKLSGGPAEVLIDGKKRARRALVTVANTAVAITPTAKSASVQILPGKARTAVLVRFGEAKVGDNTLVRAGNIAYVQNGAVVSGPKDAFADALLAQPGASTEIYFDKPDPSLRFLAARKGGGDIQDGEKEQLQWSRSEGFDTVDAAENVVAPSFARDRLPLGTSYFRSTRDLSRIGQLRLEPDAGHGCKDCLPRNTLENSGKKVVLHYEHRMPQVRLSWVAPAQEHNATVFVFADSDLKTPIVQQQMPAAFYDVPQNLLGEGVYHWYVQGAGAALGQVPKAFVNTFKIERELQTDGLVLTSPHLSQHTRRKVMICSGYVARNATLTVNGKNIVVQSDGSFRVPYKLKEGNNRLVFHVQKHRGADKYYIRDVTFHHSAG